MLTKNSFHFFLRHLLNRDTERNKFFVDAIVIAKENAQVQAIISKTEEKLIAILESFLKMRYANKQLNYYIRARMIYILTDQIAQDLLRVDIEQREDYLQLFIEEIINLSFDL